MLKRAKQSMPALVKKALADAGLQKAYAERPPYQKNDYLMWINAAKRDETKEKRLAVMLKELKAGKMYMGMRYEPRRRKVA